MKATVRCALFLLTIPITGCGPTVDDFVGSWSASGALNWSIGTNSGTEPLNGTVNVTEGAASDIRLPDGICQVDMDIKGDRATSKPGFSCTLQTQSGSAQVNYDSATATLKKEDTLSYRASGSYVPTGSSARGTFNIQMSLSRLDKRDE